MNKGKEMRLREFAYSRNKAIEKVVMENRTYSDHLIKCILYKNTTNNLWHWIDEIATKINNVNQIRLKSGNKFSRQFYMDEFFLSDGDCKEDFKITLEHFQAKYRFRYPKIEITESILELTDYVFHDLANYFSYTLSTNNNHSKEWFRNKLLDYFQDLFQEEM